MYICHKTFIYISLYTAGWPRKDAIAVLQIFTETLKFQSKSDKF